MVTFLFCFTAWWSRWWNTGDGRKNDVWPKTKSCEYYRMNVGCLTNWHQFCRLLSCYWSWISSLASICLFVCFFRITICHIVRSRSLMHCINYKFMCLYANWQWKLAIERLRISVVISKNQMESFSTYVKQNKKTQANPGECAVRIGNNL